MVSRAAIVCGVLKPKAKMRKIRRIRVGVTTEFDGIHPLGGFDQKSSRIINFLQRALDVTFRHKFIDCLARALPVSIVVELDQAPGSNVFVQLLQANPDAVIPIPIDMKQGNRSKSSLRKRVLKEALHKMAIVFQSKPRKQTAHVLDCANAAAGEDFGNLEVRIVRGGSG